MPVASCCGADFGRAEQVLTKLFCQLTKYIGHNYYMSLVNSELFGNKTKTGVLLSIFLLEETFYRELSRVLEVGLYSVQRTVEALEDEGVVRTTQLGSERRVALNPAYFAAKELKALLRKLSRLNPNLEAAIGSTRRRPRKRGKVA